MSTTTGSRGRSPRSAGGEAFEGGAAPEPGGAKVADAPSRVLAIYAHPDDPEISAGGTLARWSDAGADVDVLITTRGDKGSNDPDADTEELARTRVEETAAAARVLGVTPHHLDHPDGELADDLALRLEL